MKKEIISQKAPSAIGPYAQGVNSDGLLFISGQLPINAETGEMPEDITGQTKQSLENLKSIMEAAGGTLKDVVKCTVFLKDMNEFVDMNTVYGQYFSETFPARSTVEVARLPKDAKVEIEAIARI